MSLGTDDARLGHRELSETMGSSDADALTFVKGAMASKLPNGWPRSNDEIDALFRKYDESKNGYMSVLERMKMMNNEDFLEDYKGLPTKVQNRAFHLADKSGKADGRLSLGEFRVYVHVLPKCAALWEVFNEVDTDNNLRIDFQEFRGGIQLLGVEAEGEEEVRSAFEAVDTNHSGKIDFDEFFEYFKDREIGRTGIGRDVVSDAISRDVIPIEETAGEVTTAETAPALSSDADALTFVKGAMASKLPDGWPRSNDEIDALFRKYDENKDGYLSVSESKKMMNNEDFFEKYKGLPTKVQRRAYHLADKSGKADGRLSLIEFRVYVHVLPKCTALWEVFNEVDTDNNLRIDFQEFRGGIKLLGVEAEGEEEVRSAFEAVDTNLSGKIDFDEFFEYFKDREIGRTGI